MPSSEFFTLLIKLLSLLLGASVTVPVVVDQVGDQDVPVEEVVEGDEPAEQMVDAPAVPAPNAGAPVGDPAAPADGEDEEDAADPVVPADGEEVVADDPASDPAVPVEDEVVEDPMEPVVDPEEPTILETEGVWSDDLFGTGEVEVEYVATADPNAADDDAAIEIIAIRVPDDVEYTVEDDEDDEIEIEFVLGDSIAELEIEAEVEDGEIEIEIELEIEEIVAPMDPVDDGMDPADDGMDPADDGMDPADDGMDPADDGMDPADDGMDPADPVAPTFLTFETEFGLVHLIVEGTEISFWGVEPNGSDIEWEVERDNGERVTIELEDDDTDEESLLDIRLVDGEITVDYESDTDSEVGAGTESAEAPIQTAAESDD